MKFLTVYLDSHPLSLASQRPNKSQEADACQIWLDSLLARGVRVVIPAIADYEVRGNWFAMGIQPAQHA